MIADDVVDLFHGREMGGIDLRGATGDHDLGLGVFPPRLANGLPRLTHAFLCHRASIDDHRTFEAGVGGVLTHDFRTHRR